MLLPIKCIKLHCSLKIKTLHAQVESKDAHQGPQVLWAKPVGRDILVCAMLE